MPTPIPKFDSTILRRICDVLADTGQGLTGGEIGEILKSVGVPDPMPGGTKRYRLFEALSAKQHRDGCGNHVVAFIQVSMKPVRYTSDSSEFESRRERLNEVLAFCGLTLTETGRLRRVQAASTLGEAKAKANRLRSKLSDRGVHPDVLKFCRSELVQANYFHAVFEATKSVADKVRERSGLASDGSGLIDAAFGIGAGSPLLAFNSLSTETERSEHKGLVNLLKGLFGTFRNVTAHVPKIKWSINEQDALDILTLASMLHRRIDQAIRTSGTTN